MNELIYVGFDITKSEQQADGSLLVFGPCTDDSVDSDKQIVDPQFAATGLTKWLETGGNVREMHQPKAVGKGVELVREGNAHLLKTRVVDGNAVKLVKTKVLTAYSVGISNARVIKDVTAPGGRIVGGTFVEVSLVDRPANAGCKIDLVDKSEFSTVIDLVTKGDDGEAVYSDILTNKTGMPEGNVKCDTCKGEGKILGGNRKCPDCAGKGNMPAEKAADIKKAADQYAITRDEWIAKRTVDPSTGGGVDRDKIDDATFAGPNRTYPIVIPKDAHDAWMLAGKAEDPDAVCTKIKEIAKRKGQEFVDALPDTAKVTKGKKITKDDKGASKAPPAAGDDTTDGDTDTDDGNGDDSTKIDAPYVLKRLHDVLCPCYSTDAVLAGHPTLKSLSESIDEDYWRQATADAFGSGPDAAAPVLNAYSLISRLSKMTEEELAEARGQLHKAFADSYPSVHLSPGAVMPGQFKRPFVSGDRASMKPGQRPNMPNGASPISGSDFDRNYISAGRASNSPTSQAAKFEEVTAEGITLVKVTHEESGVVFVGVDEKSAYKAVRAEVIKQGGEMPTWKQRMFYTNNSRDQAGSIMNGLHDYIQLVHPDICSMAKPETNDVNDGTPSNSTADVLDSNSGAKPKPINGAGIGKLEDVDIKKMVAEAVDKKTAKLNKKLAKAKEEIAKLSKEPDPTDMMHRGTRSVLPFVQTTKSAEELAEQAKAEEAASELKFLTKGLIHGDAETQRNCLQKLQAILSAEELAEVLVFLH